MNLKKMKVLCSRDGNLEITEKNIKIKQVSKFFWWHSKKCWGHWHISWYDLSEKARTRHVHIIFPCIHICSILVYTNNFWLWFKSIMVVDSSKLEMIVNTKMFLTSYMQGLFWCTTSYYKKYFSPFIKWTERGTQIENIVPVLGQSDNTSIIIFYTDS